MSAWSFDEDVEMGGEGVALFEEGGWVGAGVFECSIQC